MELLSVALFMAGYIPGLIWVAGCMVMAYIFAKRKGYTGSSDHFSWSRLGKTFLSPITFSH